MTAFFRNRTIARIAVFALSFAAAGRQSEKSVKTARLFQQPATCDAAHKFAPFL
jgi:hypothetical protein